MPANRLQLEQVYSEIFVHFPVKSLVRFTCVSKCWCVLIKSRTFANKHYLKCRRNDSILLVRSYLPPPENADVFSFHNLNSPELETDRPNLTIPFLNHINPYLPRRVNLLGPNKGLVCICCNSCIILCNPALRELKRLSIPFACPKGYTDSILAQGFGHTCTDDFKVVVIRRIASHDKYIHDPKNYFIVHLYDSNTKSWRIIDGDAVVVKNLIFYPCTELFFNGFCHWNANSLGVSSPDIILTFDISNEVFGQLEYPDCVEELHGNLLFLLVVNNCFSMVRCKGWLAEPQIIDIWIMKEYGVRDSWTKTYVIGPYQVLSSFMLWKNDEWLLVESSGGQLASCALNTTEIKRFKIYGVERTLLSLIYKESLFSLSQVI